MRDSLLIFVTAVLLSVAVQYVVAQPAPLAPEPVADVPYARLVVKGSIKAGAYDGDTLKFVVPEQIITVRLLGPRLPGAKRNQGVWCPELTNPLERENAIAARTRLRELVGNGQNATLSIPLDNGDEILKFTTFSRALGEVWKDKINLGESLLNSGLALPEKN